MKKKVIIWIAAGILILAAVGVGIWFWMQNREPAEPEIPKDPNVVEGQQLADSGDLDAAIKKYEELILSKPENVDASIALAEAYAKKGDIDKARAEINRIMTLVPTETRIYDTMVKIYKEQNRYIDAALFVDSITDPTVRSSYEKKLRDENFEMYTGFGNTPGNLTNDGLVAVTDDAVYYSERMDGKALYRVDLDGKNQKKLSDLPVRDINVIGDTVYYVDTDKYQIHSVKTDGSDDKVLLDVFAQRLMIIGDRLYYSNWGDECKIYSAKLDGTDNKKTIDVQVSEMALSGAWLYYIDRSQNEVLARVRIDGQEQMQLNDLNCLFVNGMGENIYYVNWGDEGKLYHCLRDLSTEPVALTESKVGYVNLYGDWIYYIDWVKGENVYRKNIKDGTVEQVSKDPSEGVFVKGEHVYYYNTADGKRLYRVDLDGKNRTLMGK